ncbi:MAG TPA: hypothetical protein PKN75_15070 [Bacteroidia bacterium]|nr:hypothetical protein [Bacteroidia bacterium]HNU34907.1 hypothetical protein [Bacteroidia bacterium]
MKFRVFALFVLIKIIIVHEAYSQVFIPLGCDSIRAMVKTHWIKDEIGNCGFRHLVTNVLVEKQCLINLSPATIKYMLGEPEYPNESFSGELIYTYPVVKTKNKNGFGNQFLYIEFGKDSLVSKVIINVVDE